MTPTAWASRLNSARGDGEDRDRPRRPPATPRRTSPRSCRRRDSSTMTVSVANALEQRDQVDSAHVDASLVVLVRVVRRRKMLSASISVTRTR